MKKLHNKSLESLLSAVLMLHDTDGNPVKVSFKKVLTKAVYSQFPEEVHELEAGRMAEKEKRLVVIPNDYKYQDDDGHELGDNK